jgi:hypothetical protein
MLTQIEAFDLSQILQPAQRPEDARQDAIAFGASQTITKGVAIGIKTADKKGYIMVPGAGDGTQNFAGFNMYSIVTDATGLVYQGTTAGPNVRLGPWTTSPIWVNGIFNPQDVQTKGTPAGEVDTFTPGGTITTGDIYKLTLTLNTGATYVVQITVGATATAAAVSAAMIAAWNADKTASYYAVASGSTTVVLTAQNLGTALNVASSVTGVGTFTKVQTTAATGRSIADITPGRPGACVLHNGFWKV